MGRTVLSARMQLEEEIAELSRFRFALRKEERQLFDTAMSHAKKHISAISYCQSINIMEPVLLCIIIEMERRLQELEKRKT